VQRSGSLHGFTTRSPIEVTVGAVADFVKELSECSPSLAAGQIEYSTFEIEAQRNGLLEACEELGVAVVAYSRLSRDFLTAAYTTKP
jgi:aryl-alcohol dehydrogenase-like predicted oxidoreductase